MRLRPLLQGAGSRGTARGQGRRGVWGVWGVHTARRVLQQVPGVAGRGDDDDEVDARCAARVQGKAPCARPPPQSNTGRGHAVWCVSACVC